jgi:hypothetical protein
MNWKSTACSEVAKERIWKEHVANEGSKVRIFDQFRKNPYHVSKDKPLSDPVNRRPQHFLDRERSFLETIERRIATQHSHERPGLDGAESVVLPPISTPRGAGGVAPPSPRLATVSAAMSSETFDFGTVWNSMQSVPAKKYPEPLTEAQELGWVQSPMKPRDPRFTYNHRSTEMTRFARQLHREQGASKGTSKR